MGRVEMATARQRVADGPSESGDDLLSHAVTSAVPSALEGLTSVFGMGTGVAPPASPPGTEWQSEHDDSRVQPSDVSNV